MQLLRIREILKEKNITSKKLSEMVGVTQASISNIVKNDALPRKELLLKIAQCLNVDIRDLFHSTKGGKVYLIIDNELTCFDNVDELKKYIDELE